LEAHVGRVEATVPVEALDERVDRERRAVGEDGGVVTGGDDQRAALGVHTCAGGAQQGADDGVLARVGVLSWWVGFQGTGLRETGPGWARYQSGSRAARARGRSITMSRVAAGPREGRWRSPTPRGSIDRGARAGSRRRRPRRA